MKSDCETRYVKEQIKNLSYYMGDLRWHRKNLLKQGEAETSDRIQTIDNLLRDAEQELTRLRFSMG